MKCKRQENIEKKLIFFLSQNLGFSSFKFLIILLIQYNNHLEFDFLIYIVFV